MKIILASKSPRRKMLLEQLGLEFDIIPSQEDESQIQEQDPRELVRKLAELKASSVAKGLDSNALVIGSDTIVFFQGRPIGQPRDEQHAREMLRMLSGQTHEVFTGTCLINTQTGERFFDTTRTLVTFRELSDQDIEKCLEHKIILGGAGSYTPELYSRIFEKLEGSYTNVVGLPTEKLIPMLRSQGVDV